MDCRLHVRIHADALRELVDSDLGLQAVGRTRTSDPVGLIRRSDLGMAVSWPRGSRFARAPLCGPRFARAPLCGPRFARAPLCGPRFARAPLCGPRFARAPPSGPPCVPAPPSDGLPWAALV